MQDEGEAEFGRFTAVCAVSDARCALTVFAEWSWAPRTLTLVPVDGEENEYSEAAMEFALIE